MPPLGHLPPKFGNCFPATVYSNRAKTPLVTTGFTTRVKRVAGARAYMHPNTTEAPTSETVWISEGNTQASHTFSGLKSGVKYWFRVVGLGDDSQTVYSPVEQRIVQ